MSAIQARGQQVLAATWAVYNNTQAGFGENEAQLRDFASRNNAALSAASGLDLGALLAKQNAGGALAATSVDRNLGALLEDLLAKAGMKATGDISVSLYGEDQARPLDAAGSPGVSTRMSLSGGGVDMNRIYAQMKDNAEVRVAYQRLEEALARQQGLDRASLDLSGLDFAYADGASGRAVEIRSSQGFVYSAADSAMVGVRSLDVAYTGYTYQKKLSDTYSPTADFDYVFGMAGVREMVDQAKASGATIASTVTEEEWNSMPPMMGPPGEFKANMIVNNPGEGAGVGEAGSSADSAKIGGAKDTNAGLYRGDPLAQAINHLESTRRQFADRAVSSQTTRKHALTAMLFKAYAGVQAPNRGAWR
jgi:hypothetical protein